MLVTGTIEEQCAKEKEQRTIRFNKYVNDFNKTKDTSGIMETQVGNILFKLTYNGTTTNKLPVHKKIKEYLEAPTTGQRKKDLDYLRNMTEDINVLVFTTLSTIFSAIVKQKNNARLTQVSKSILGNLLKEQTKEALKASDPKMFKYMDTQYKRASKRRKELLMKNHIRNLQDRVDYADGIRYDNSINNQAQDMRVGTILIECMIASGVNIIEVGALRNKGKPGFTRTLRLTKKAHELMTASHQHIISNLISHYPPMVCKPRPWTTNYSGGLYTVDNPIIKIRSKEGSRILKETPLDKVYPVLNRLQDTSWRINTFVLDLIQALFDGDMIDPQSPRKLKRLYGSLPTATPMDACDLIKKESYGTLSDDGRFDDIEAFKKWRLDSEAVTVSLDGEMGRRLQIIAALGEAQAFRNYKDIWFAYNLDTRGRVYTLQSLITPQSSSTIKALLMFSNGRLLNADGEKWFKVHTANVFGNDKDEFHDRTSWFDSNIDTIRCVGTAPLDCLADWAYCDSPFEFVAACNAWVRHEAGDEVYVPIQLDATNSGVQIYSGLLGDLEGAKTVNVVNLVVDDTIKRADVYGIVAAKVNKALLSGNYPKMFHVSLSDGNEKSQSTWLEAQSIAGNITRKHTKRNTMTVPYSVSKRGMSDQIWMLIDEARLEEKEWWKGDPWVVNKLLTDLNYDAIYETIPGAKVGQDYLVSLAHLCNEKGGMIYTTPIYDIPVVQKKPKREVHEVSTLLGRLNIRTDIPNSLDRMAQKNGSAPNFIHSIDSTLLLYVIEHMSDNIGVIHDCFLSHANDGYELQEVFKTGYVKIMRMKPLELIGRQLDPEGILEVPYIGTLDLSLVMDAEYIIS